METRLSVCAVSVHSLCECDECVELVGGADQLGCQHYQLSLTGPRDKIVL